MDIDIDIDRFVEKYVAVWNEPDSAARRKVIGELWDADSTETVQSARYHGHDALEARIAEAHKNLVRDAGYVFRSAGDATGHHDTITFTTHMAPAAGGGIAWTGRIVLTLGENGRIRNEYQFTVDTVAETKPSS
ncbi:nuclear transport factor 2 family protein [Streptomyces sp. NPDC048565]|uniref:nuclear transport factor 2 family protein n=1 Tax=Streptomyces sp. NPDC048565 TaxID=3155266 RepID=UPI003415F1AA